MVDFSLTTQAPTITRDVDNVLQQIDMLFDTLKGEVIGEPYYGSDFTQYIWDLKMSNSEIASYVSSIISSNVKLLDFEYNVNVELLEGTQNDIILITISLRRDYEFEEKTYKIG